MKPPFSPDFGKLLDDYIRGALTSVFKTMPGKISEYNNTLKTAKVEVLLKYKDGDLIKSYPQLLDVPVFQLTGGDGGVTVPIEAGDPCLVVFADRDIDNWFSTGGAEVPASNRIHNLGDGFAFVGFRPVTDPIAPPDSAAVSLYKDGTQVSVKGNKVAVKNPDTNAKELLDLIISAVNSALSGMKVSFTADVGGSSTNFNVSPSYTFTPPDPGELFYTGDED